MTSIVPDSPALRSALRALSVEKRREIRAKRHPWIGRRMVILGSSTPAGDELVRALVAQFGECGWSRGRWRVARVQLRFPGM